MFRFVFLFFLLINFSACSLFYVTEKTYIYQVKSGDTLASIAANFQMDYQELARYNRITNANQISVGQVLEIPFENSLREANNQIPSEVEFASPKIFSRNANTKPNHNLLHWPVRSREARLSSKFGWRWTKFHEGLDIAAPTGTRIYAAHAGQVKMSGYQIRGYGRMLIIQNGDLLTVYAHNNKNYVDVGQNVSVGQHIADVGATGKTTGPHLHFEVRFRNKDRKFVAVDPRLYLP